MEYDRFYKYLEGRPLGEIEKCQQIIDEIIIQRKIEFSGEASLEALNQSQSETETVDETEKARVKQVMDNIVTAHLLVPHGMNGYNRDTKRFVRWVPGYNRPAPPAIALQQNIRQDWFIHKELQLYLHWCLDGYYEMSCKDSLKFNQSYPENRHLVPTPSPPPEAKATQALEAVKLVFEAAPEQEKRKSISFALPARDKKHKSSVHSIAKNWSYFSESEEEEKEPPESKMTDPKTVQIQGEVQKPMGSPKKASVEEAAEPVQPAPRPEEVKSTSSTQPPTPVPTTEVPIMPASLLVSSVASSSEDLPHSAKVSPLVGSTVRVLQGTMKGEVGTVLGNHWSSETVFRVQFHGKADAFPREHLQVIEKPQDLHPPSPPPPVVPTPLTVEPAVVEASVTEPPSQVTPPPAEPTMHIVPMTDAEPNTTAGPAAVPPANPQRQPIPASVATPAVGNNVTHPAYVVPVAPPQHTSAKPSLPFVPRAVALTSGAQVVRPAYPTGPTEPIGFQGAQYQYPQQVYTPFPAYGLPGYPHQMLVPPFQPVQPAPPTNYGPPPPQYPHPHHHQQQHQQHFNAPPPLRAPPQPAPPLQVPAQEEGVCWVRVKSGSYVNEEGVFLYQNPNDTTLAHVKFYSRTGGQGYVTQLKVCNLAVFSLTNRAKEVPLDAYLTVRRMDQAERHGLESDIDRAVQVLPRPGPSVHPADQHPGGPSTAGAQVGATRQNGTTRSPAGRVDQAPQLRDDTMREDPRREESWKEEAQREETRRSARREEVEREEVARREETRREAIRKEEVRREEARREETRRENEHGRRCTASRSPSPHRRDLSSGRGSDHTSDRSRHGSERRLSPRGRTGRSSSPSPRRDRDQRDRDSRSESDRRRDEEHREERERERRQEERVRERERERERERDHERVREMERENRAREDEKRQRERDRVRDEERAREEEERDRERRRNEGRERKRLREERDRAEAQREASPDRQRSRRGDEVTSNRSSGREQDRDQDREQRSGSEADGRQRDRDWERANQDRQPRRESSHSSSDSPPREEPGRTQTTTPTSSTTPTTSGYLRNVMHAINVPERVRTVGLAERPRDPFPLRLGQQSDPPGTITPPTVPTIPPPAIPPVEPQPPLHIGDLIKVVRGAHAGLIAVVVEPPTSERSPDGVLQEYMVLLNDGKNSVVRLTPDFFTPEEN